MAKTKGRHRRETLTEALVRKARAVAFSLIRKANA